MVDSLGTAMRLRRTTGVRPMVLRMDEWMRDMGGWGVEATRVEVGRGRESPRNSSVKNAASLLVFATLAAQGRPYSRHHLAAPVQL